MRPKRTLALLAGVTVGVALSACGSADSDRLASGELSPSASATTNPEATSSPEDIACSQGDRFVQFSATISADPVGGYDTPELALDALKREKGVKPDLSKQKEEYKTKDGREVASKAEAAEVTHLFADASGAPKLAISSSKIGPRWHGTEMRGCLSSFGGAQ